MSKRSVSWYRKAKWACFIGAILSAFVPTIVATAICFPLVEASTGEKIAVGMIVIFISFAVVFLGAFRALTVKLPLFNWVALIDLIGGLVMEQFTAFYSSVKIIEIVAVAGSIVFAVLWLKYERYKVQLLSAKTNREMGLI